jgi:hypothetical protein
MNNIGKKFTAVFAIAGIVLGVSPIAYAGTIRIVNNNSADITNAVSTTAISGGNVSHGEGGGVGGNGGELVLDNTNSSITGDVRGGHGGRGGNGGHGGTITTGEAIATTQIRNDINTTETVVEDVLDETCDAESFDMSSQVGESSNRASDMSENKAKSTSDTSTLSMLDNRESTLAETFASDAVSTATEEGAADASASASAFESSSDNSVSTAEASHDTAESSSESNSSAVLEASSEARTLDETNSDTSTLDEAAASTLDKTMAMTMSESEAAESHDNQERHSTCVRGGDRNNINVENTNTAAADNAVSILATSGDNVSEGGLANDGGFGGSAVITGDDNDIDGGIIAGVGGDGGNGGNGGNVSAGRADSLTDIVNTSGRTITRVVRS